MNKSNIKISTKFLNEDLGIHWQVDESKESFERLLYHLEVKTNEKPFFEEALRHLNLDDDSFTKGLVAADIGAGVCWPSAILATHPKVRLVYAVEPSVNRLKHAHFVIKHFGIESKIKIIRGTFLEPNIPEKVDLILLCGSLHHCYDEDLTELFLNMKRLLKSDGTILITNEHYIDWIWVFKRLLSYAKHFTDRTKLYFYPLNKLRAPDPIGGNHWRFRKELEAVLKEHGFAVRFFMHNGYLLHRDKPMIYQRMGWHFYHAILRLKDVRES